MNKLFFALVIASGLIACGTSDKKAGETKIDSSKILSPEQIQKITEDTANYTTIQWLDSTHLDLGKVKEGKIVEVSYRFKNTGNKPLFITNVSASCGCTVPEKPQEAILPGQENVIKASFDSKNRPGEARKSIYVMANTLPKDQELTFRVEVTN